MAPHGRFVLPKHHLCVRPPKDHRIASGNFLMFVFCRKKSGKGMLRYTLYTSNFLAKILTFLFPA